jgi:hypothetical protein
MIIRCIFMYTYRHTLYTYIQALRETLLGRGRLIFYIDICIYIYMHIYVYIYVYIHTCTCIFQLINTYTYIQALRETLLGRGRSIFCQFLTAYLVCIYTCIYIYLYTYVNIWSFICTYSVSINIYGHNFINWYICIYM